MVGQYFKKQREAVEIVLVAASGAGMAVMTAVMHLNLRLDLDIFKRNGILCMMK